MKKLGYRNYFITYIGDPDRQISTRVQREQMTDTQTVTRITCTQVAPALLAG